jgi:hypothetical protein
MAKPNVMVSSTYYDLRQIRDDLRQFIEDDLGYGAVLSELPSFPVDPSADTIMNCRLKVKEDADILVLIVGGRYGSIDLKADLSITNLEYEEARLKGIPIFAFVDKSVLANLQTWSANQGADFKHVVDSSRVFEFVDRVRARDGIWVFPFETAQNIVDALRAQLANLFIRNFAVAQRVAGSGAPGWYDGLSATALRIALDRPANWEGLLLLRVWADEIDARMRLFRELASGMRLRTPEHVVVGNAASWMLARLHDLSGVTISATELINVQLPLAMKQVGTEADAEHIVWIARYLGLAYEHVVEWAINMRCALVDDPFAEVGAELERLASQVISRLREFPAEALAKLENAIANPSEAPTVELTLVFREIDTTGFDASMARAQQRLEDGDF